MTYVDPGRILTVDEIRSVAASRLNVNAATLTVDAPEFYYLGRNTLEQRPTTESMTTLEVTYRVRTAQQKFFFTASDGRLVGQADVRGGEASGPTIEDAGREIAERRNNADATARWLMIIGAVVVLIGFGFYIRRTWNEPG